jgi:hypothetical protein
MSSTTTVPLPNWLNDTKVEMIDDARRELISQFRKIAETANGQPIELADDFFDSISDKLPESARGGSRSVFVQAFTDDVSGEQNLMLNKTYAGHSLLFSRFLHCYDDVAEETVKRLVDILDRARPDDSVYAELSGGFESTNLNLHPRVVPFELVCPGDSSSLPDEQQIAIGDLSIRRRDDGQLALWSRTLEKYVIPLYLGFLVPSTLPEIQRNLLLFSPIEINRFELWGGTDLPLGNRPIASHPRVSYGNIVLVRKTWKMVPEYLPSRITYRSAHEWFLDLQKWRLANAIPEQVFVSVDAGDKLTRTSHKPQFVDFSSAVSVQILDRFVDKSNRRVVMNEALPNPRSQGLAIAGARHTAEFVFEFYQDGGAASW